MATPSVRSDNDFRPPDKKKSFRLDHHQAHQQVLIISGKSFRMVGSPPVSRIFLIPCLTNKLDRYRISSVVRSCEDGDSWTPSDGMQYLQRRLQRSVKDILKYVWCLPNVSNSGFANKFSWKMLKSAETFFWVTRNTNLLQWECSFCWLISPHRATQQLPFLNPPKHDSLFTVREVWLLMINFLPHQPNSWKSSQLLSWVITTCLLNMNIFWMTLVT